MRNRRAVRAELGALAAVALLSGACAAPIRLGAGPTPSRITPAPAAVADAALREAPKVVTRYYKYAPTVSVLGWEAEEAAFGLRAIVRRDGSLVRDHEIYVSTYYFADIIGFMRADWQVDTSSVAAPVRLERTGYYRDSRACEGKMGCTPFSTLSARLPDDLLRRSREDIVLKVLQRDGTAEVITIGRDLIDAYLTRVNYVAASLSKM